MRAQSARDEAPGAQTRAVPLRPPERPEPEGAQIEHRCELGPAYVEVVAGVETERIALGAGSKDTGTFREFIRLVCDQCVGEMHSHGDCEEYSWSCHSTRIDLTQTDRGEPMRGSDVTLWSSTPREDAEPLLRGIDQFLEHVEEPGRYGYLDKDRARGLAQRIKSEIPTLEGSPTREFPSGETRRSVLLEVPDGIVSVHEGTIRVLTWSPLGLGRAPCEGVHGPSGRAKGSVIRSHRP